MKRAVIIGAADFASLRRQLPDTELAGLVGRIERGFRTILGLDGLSDDDVIAATMNPADQNETERAGLRVIRACIAYREADEAARNPRLDHLETVLGAADPNRILGAELRRRNIVAGNKTGDKRKCDAERLDSKIRRAARAIRDTNPAISQKELAALIKERDELKDVAYATLLKKIARPRKS